MTGMWDQTSVEDKQFTTGSGDLQRDKVDKLSQFNSGLSEEKDESKMTPRFLTFTTNATR